MSNQFPTSTAAPRYRMPVGYNLPWARNDCGFNFGPNPYDLTQQDPLWKDSLPVTLAKLQSLGISVVRWFILANGWNYGPSPDPYWAPPLGWVWSFDPPDTVDPRFARYFEQALQAFKKISTQDKPIQILPSLVSFEFFGRGPEAGTQPVYGAGGRADLALDTAKTEKFFKTMFDPLLDLSADAKYKSLIYAWEVMNEPIWTMSRRMTGGYLGRNDLVAFLNAGIRRIDDHGLVSTVGHRYITDISTLPAGTKPQFHYYAHWMTTDDPRILPTQPNAFLGEFGSEHTGQYSHSLTDVDPSSQWPELDSKDKDSNTIVFERLKLLESKHYSLAMVWPDLKPDNNIAFNDAMKLSENKQDQIKRFTAQP